MSAVVYRGIWSWLHLSAGSFIASLVLYYRLDDGVTSLWSFVTGAAWMCAAAFGISTFALTQLVRSCRRSGGLASKPIRLFLAMSVVSIALMLMLSEAMVRIFTEPHPEGPLIADFRLLPRNWQDVAAFRRAYWERYATDSGVFIFDPELGWTVAPNRKGIGPAHEHNFSSAEGTRAPGEGIRFGDCSVCTRIALIGDSYVFGSDVAYEDTWGYQLQQRLGRNVQVLNFGVPGYGIDQAYLRYLKDVRLGRYDVVILGIISDDLLRTTMVYYAVGFPGAVVPGAKPRFTLKDGKPTLVNVPLPRPEEVYATRSIADLPFIHYDRAYRPTEWQPHWYEFSYLLRFAVSWSPQQGRVTESPSANDETTSLNGAIVHAFVHEATAAGTIPIVVFFPSFTEFRDATVLRSRTPLLGMQVLKQAGVEFVDLTGCVARVEEQRRFTTGWHYTPQTNSSVADCLRDVVMTRLSGSSIRTSSLAHIIHDGS